MSEEQHAVQRGGVSAVRLTTSAEVMGGGGRRVEARTEATGAVIRR